MYVFGITNYESRIANKYEHVYIHLQELSQLSVSLVLAKMPFECFFEV